METEAVVSLDRSMTIYQTIIVEFDSERHGIFLEIPERYKTDYWYMPYIKLPVTDIYVEDGDGNPLTYESYKEGDYRIIKIGDADIFVNGIQTYVVTYKISDVVSFFKGHDEIFTNLIGHDWPVEIIHGIASLQVDGELLAELGGDVSDLETVCYTGVRGAQLTYCEIEAFTNGYIVTATNEINPYTGLTFGVKFPKGVFPEPTFYEKYKYVMLLNIGLLLPPVSLFFSYRFWAKHGKDAKGRGTIVPYFERPELSPAEVGTLIDNSADNLEISATVIDLAIRGYIKLEEIPKKKFAPQNYRIHLLKEDFKGLEVHERLFLEKIQSKVSAKKEKSVTLNQLKSGMYTVMEKIKKDLYQGLVSEGIYTTHPHEYRDSMAAFGGLMFGSAFFVFGGLIDIGAIGSVFGIALSGVILFIFSRYMSQRTTKGTQELEYILGLKEYINTAEADRIEMMQDPDSPYAKSPDNTIELFEKLLPYAIVLGVEKNWGERFKDLYTEPPEWYSGQYPHNFNAYHLVNSLNSATTTMGHTLGAVPATASGGFSSSSGFSGGGFSGGGSGGGGGGSW